MTNPIEVFAGTFQAVKSGEIDSIICARGSNAHQCFGLVAGVCSPLLGEEGTA